jgi:hypothetical protein
VLSTAAAGAAITSITVNNAAILSATTSMVILGAPIYTGNGIPVVRVGAVSVGSFTLLVMNAHPSAVLSAALSVPVFVINHSA